MLTNVRASQLGTRKLVLEDSERLVPDLVAAIDSFLEGQTPGADVAEWAESLTRKYTVPAELALVGAALTALSFLRYPQATIKVTSDQLRSLKEALQGRSDYEIRYRNSVAVEHLDPALGPIRVIPIEATGNVDIAITERSSTQATDKKGRSGKARQ